MLINVETTFLLYFKLGTIKENYKGEIEHIVSSLSGLKIWLGQINHINIIQSKK